MITSIQAAREAFAAGRLSSRALVEESLERIHDPAGEGKFAFTRIYAEQARRAAKLADHCKETNLKLPSVAGIPVSIKDLFDVRGEVTLAGSVLRRSASPAQADAVAVMRLRAAGAVILGRTNMTEFAYSGVGLNPHYGTPANPYDRAARRIPGGSSSGAAVSVSDGMVLAALASDTGGSIRIPAALCGLTGFKPTQSRVRTTGMFPLSTALDSIGPIARTVHCCYLLDAILSGDAPWELRELPLRGQTFAVPTNYFLDDLDRHVAECFDRALALLSKAGVKILPIAIKEIDDMVTANAGGGFTAAEAYAFHSKMNHDLDQCDPLVRERIVLGRTISAADYRDLLDRRLAFIDRFRKYWNRFDLLICPTVPLVAPQMAALEASAEEFRRVNRLLLRNPSVVNFLDACAITLPCHRAGEAPVGLMAVGATLQDKFLLSIALSIEQVLASHPAAIESRHVLS